MLFKYLEVLLMSVERVELMYRCGESIAKCSAKLLIFWFSCVFAFMYGHQLCVVTERIGSEIQVAEISFL